jgi:hypothetical protein
MNAAAPAAAPVQVVRFGRPPSADGDGTVKRFGMAALSTLLTAAQAAPACIRRGACAPPHRGERYVPLPAAQAATDAVALTAWTAAGAAAAASSSSSRLRRGRPPSHYCAVITTYQNHAYGPCRVRVRGDGDGGDGGDRGYCRHHGGGEPAVRRPFGDVDAYVSLDPRGRAALERRIAGVPHRQRTNRAPDAAVPRSRAFIRSLRQYGPPAAARALLKVFEQRRLVLKVKRRAKAAGITRKRLPADARLRRCFAHVTRMRWTAEQQQRIATNFRLEPAELMACWGDFNRVRTGLRKKRMARQQAG